MAGKGSVPRPLGIPQQVWDDRFDAIFRKPDPLAQYSIDPQGTISNGDGEVVGKSEMAMLDPSEQVTATMPDLTMERNSSIIRERMVAEAGRTSFTDKEMLDWIEDMHTLHQQVEFLYVVDGYDCCITKDGMADQHYHGETIREALAKAMVGPHGMGGDHG